mgnify:FL=1
MLRGELPLSHFIFQKGNAMLYRIDLEHFLTHMVDFFTVEEITACNYIILGTIPNNGRSSSNVVKLNELYPETDTLLKYEETHNTDILRGEYLEHLKEPHVQNLIYESFLNNVLNHVSIVLLSRADENFWVDILIEYLKDEYHVETIDLNELFKTGQVGPIRIDYDEIHNRSVDVRRQAGKEMIRSLESTRGGREKLLGMMDSKEKIRKCKDLGIKVTKADINNLDEILMEAWVEED